MTTTKSVLRSIKNVTNGYTSAQVMVRNATSNDPSGPTVSQMADIANHTFDRGELLEIMDIVDRRLNDKGKNWRHVAKSLTLLDYLVRYGSEDTVIWAKDNVYVIKTLREFQASDSMGRDQGAIVRVKAKELSDLLSDDDRLREERQVALRNRNVPHGRGRREDVNSALGDNEDYDSDLQQAIEESRQTAEEEEQKRRKNSDASLNRAIQLSLEEEEMRKKNTNLLDINEHNGDDAAPAVLGYYSAQPQVSTAQIIGYDMYGNPVYANQPMATGYLQNAYQSSAAQQQQLYQQQLYQQQLEAAQRQQQQQQQQNVVIQQSLNAQVPAPTGSNNPFALSNVQSNPTSSMVSATQQQPQQSQLLQAGHNTPQQSMSAGNQKINDQYAELNNLLAQGTGIDTFGNEGDARIPAQHTKTGAFFNSYGTGFRQEGERQDNSQFSETQYVGIPSTIVAAPTGYGFGNQRQSSEPKQPKGSLIDL